jgi:hypothetical protein
MSQNDNPFVRGFRRLSVQRLLAISTEPGTPLIYLPLHSSQDGVQDDQVLQCPVIYGEQFALKADEPYAPSNLLAECTSVGWVQTVVHALLTEVDGKAVHVCDTYSRSAAQALVQQLTFENGVFSRCWEISTAHVCQTSLQYLHGLIRSARPSTLLFDTFRVPVGNLIGIKLLSTPWTDQHLQAIENTTAQALREQHEAAGIPPMLLNVLHLAGEADVRFLFLDPDGLVLNDLPVHDEDDEDDDECAAPDQSEFPY